MIDGKINDETAGSAIGFSSSEYISPTKCYGHWLDDPLNCRRDNDEWDSLIMCYDGGLIGLYIIGWREGPYKNTRHFISHVTHTEPMVKGVTVFSLLFSNQMLVLRNTILR